MVNQILNGTPEAEEATLKKMQDEHKEQQEKLESNAESVLTKLRGESTPEPEPESNPEPDPKPESESDPQSEPDPKSEPEPEPKPDPEPEPKPVDKEPEPADEHALTQAEIRAAIHNGLSQEDIDELAEVNPRFAKKTCAKALEAQNNLSKKFSELGKTQVTQQVTPVVPAVPTIPTPAPQPKSIDFTALEEQYENDPIVGVLKQVVEQGQAQATELATLREAGVQGDEKVTAAQVQQDAATSQQIDSFFERPDVVVYKDTYGEVEKGSKDWDNLTQGQIKKRYEVAEQANLIMLGAQQQGMDMPLDEAFERAHLLATEGVREQTIRKEIKAKATKRSKSLTLAPTDSVKVADTGKKTMAKTLKNAAQSLAKLRNRR